MASAIERSLSFSTASVVGIIESVNVSYNDYKEKIAAEKVFYSNQEIEKAVKAERFNTHTLPNILINYAAEFTLATVELAKRTLTVDQSAESRKYATAVAEMAAYVAILSYTTGVQLNLQQRLVEVLSAHADENDEVNHIDR